MGPLAVGSVADLKACIVNIIAFMMIKIRIPGSVYLDDNQKAGARKPNTGDVRMNEKSK